MKKKKLTPPSIYEETLLWMSYRYAIGRKTIAAHCHALDIAQNEYKRYIECCPERAEFMAKDINSEIASILRFNDFYIDFQLNSGENPLNLFYEFVNSRQIKDFSELDFYAIHVDRKILGLIESKAAYEFIIKNSEDKKRIHYLHDFEDLDVWQRLASLFNKNDHFYAITNDNKVIEYFYAYILTKDSEDRLFYKQIMIPVEAYVKNPHICTYLREENLTKYHLKENEISEQKYE